MAKRALLIGCNYPKTQFELQGCVNDVFNMKRLFEECFGFDDFIILVDNDKKYEKPTGRRIKETLRQLVEKTKDGDILLMHFSGHGTQVASDDPSEEDMMDECLVPTDMNLLLDDDLREIVKGLPKDAVFTFISDCCHSGGMLDHHEVQITGPKDQKAVPKLDTASILSAFGLRDKGLPEEQVKNRSLPPDLLMTVLGRETGKEVTTGNLRTTLDAFFGKDASSKITEYVSMAQSFLMGDEDKKNPGCFSKLMTILAPFLSSGGSASTTNAPPPPELEHVKPGRKPPLEKQLADDVGVLITGCQAHETSADACPGGNPANAYGALSNAIQTVVRAHKKKNKNAEISNKDLVFAVRRMLSEGYYQQNPCLECSQKNANRGFVTGTEL